MKKSCTPYITVLVILLLLFPIPVYAEEEIQSSGIYSFVHITDTQYYTALAPEVFLAQCRFIADNRERCNIQFVAHCGDIIDCYSLDNQWENARSGIKIIEEAGIPVLIAAGNHDTGFNSEYTKFLDCFGPDRKENGSSEMYYDSSGEASAQIIEAGNGHRWIFVGIGWDASDAALYWASDILTRNSDCTAVVVTHDYLEVNGTLSASGSRIFSCLVYSHPNVRLVLCGHNHACAVNVSAFDDNSDGIADRRVFSILADFQSDGDLLTGNLRLLTVNEEEKIIYVQTYSTETRNYTDDAFIIRMDGIWFQDDVAEGD